MTVDHAVTALDYESGNIYVFTASTSYDTDVTVRSNDARDKYVKWSIEVEDRLNGSLHRDELLSVVSSPQYRDISLMPGGEQLLRPVSAEVASKLDLFQLMSRELKERRARLARSPGTSSVVDTNFMIHCLRPDQIKWKTIIKNDVRLVVPIRVVEEFDAMKSDNKVRLRKSSREILSWLESLFNQSSTGPTKIRSDEETTIEVLLTERPAIDQAIQMRKYLTSVTILSDSMGNPFSYQPTTE